VSFVRATDGSWRVRLDPVTRTAAAHEEERRSTPSERLGTGTLACDRCAAPIAIGARPLLPTDALTCPYCNRRAAARDFLSMAAPARPARVEVRVRIAGRRTSRG